MLTRFPGTTEEDAADLLAAAMVQSSSPQAEMRFTTTMSRCGVSRGLLGDEVAPKESSILRFRHLLKLPRLPFMPFAPYSEQHRRKPTLESMRMVYSHVTADTEGKQ
jgi:hypothetical protein